MSNWLIWFDNAALVKNISYVNGRISHCSSNYVTGFITFTIATNVWFRLTYFKTQHLCKKNPTKGTSLAQGSDEHWHNGTGKSVTSCLLVYKS